MKSGMGLKHIPLVNIYISTIFCHKASVHSYWTSCPTQFCYIWNHQRMIVLKLAPHFYSIVVFQP